jgi:hypothetical protein
MNNSKHNNMTDAPTGPLLRGLSSESQTLLTDPPLAAIYGGRDNIIDESLSTEEEEKVSSQNDMSNTKKSNRVMRMRTKSVVRTPEALELVTSIFWRVIKTVISGSSMSFLFDTIHQSNASMIPSFHPFFHLSQSESINIVLHSLFLDGLVNSLTTSTNNTLDTSNPSPESASILKLITGLAGIAYSFKKLPWTSTLQADMVLLIAGIVFALYVGCQWQSIELKSCGMVFATACAYYRLAMRVPADEVLWQAGVVFIMTVVFAQLRKPLRV